jgi:hypothetical protein
MSSNSISLSHRNLLHHVEVTANRNISDVNGLVFSYTNLGLGLGLGLIWRDN